MHYSKKVFIFLWFIVIYFFSFFFSMSLYVFLFVPKSLFSFSFLFFLFSTPYLSISTAFHKTSAHKLYDQFYFEYITKIFLCLCNHNIAEVVYEIFFRTIHLENKAISCSFCNQIIILWCLHLCWMFYFFFFFFFFFFLILQILDIMVIAIKY